MPRCIDSSWVSLHRSCIRSFRYSSFLESDRSRICAFADTSPAQIFNGALLEGLVWSDRVTEQVADTDPFPYKDGSRRLELSVVSVFFPYDLEAAFRVPFQAVFISLPDMGCNTLDAVLSRSLYNDFI